MTTAALLFAADDEDVVESSVRHNLRYVDAVFVIGLGSADSTAAIVEALAGEGLATAFSRAPSGTTLAAHAKATLRALAGEPAVDHAVVMTADQFLEGPPAALRDALLNEPAPAFLAPRLVRVPTETDVWGESDPYRRLVHRRLIEPEHRSVAFLSRAVFGTVSIAPDGLFGEGEIEGARPLESVTVAQLPVRNALQFAALVTHRVGEISRAGAGTDPERVRYWMRMADRVLRQPLLPPTALRAAAAAFECDDPMPLAEDRPAIAADHLVRYPAEAAVGLDQAEDILKEVRATRATPAAPAPPA